MPNAVLYFIKGAKQHLGVKHIFFQRNKDNLTIADFENNLE